MIEGYKNLFNIYKTNFNNSLNDILLKKQQFSTKTQPNCSINNEKESKNILMDELNSLIGLNNVKKLIEEIIAYIRIQNIRKQKGLTSQSVVLHMVFKGNPGTGKTTVARIVGKIFNRLGILEKGHLIEIERADIVGEYIGHTAIKVKQQINKALGGILFIDEAYSLARGGKNDFGKEAIDTLVKAMESNRENFILILAGYKTEMEMFLRSNPGLKSRIPIYVNFNDYTINELIKIGKNMASERQYKLTQNAVIKLREIVENSDTYSNGNARFIRNIIERAIRKQAVRVDKKSCITRVDLLYIMAEDIDKKLTY